MLVGAITEKMLNKWMLLVVVLSGMYHRVLCGVGENKHTVSLFQTSHQNRAGRQCHDFCAMIPDMCRNGGTCVIDEDTCIGRCLCVPGWTGQWCKDPHPIPDFEEDPLNKNDVTTAREIPEITENSPPAKTDHSIETTSLTEKIRQSVLRELHDSRFTHDSPSVMSSPSMQPTTPNALSSAQTDMPESEDDQTLRKKCDENCVNGECIKINEVYKCKHRVDVTDKSVKKVCSPGFECDHGVCDLEALGANSYSCICESNYVGQFCTMKCPFDCGEHGFCDMHVPDNTYKCFCQWNYTGLNCSELVPEEPGHPLPEEVLFHWYVVGGSVAMVIVIVSMVFAIAYLMWKKRLVFMLKIVHYFQHYEDDDGKKYDAFVSYKSCPRDEQFVLHQLFPRLEREYNFKLCMHFRDFLPGEAIANNIVSAIENSRRTIMVLSPEYVQSEWCRMEYQKAQHEMLKLKHKIIPIVLSDLSEVKNIDKNLKSIMNSVTYLEWPGQENSKKSERFWKKLELSLPKRSTQHATYSESYSSESCTSAVSQSDTTSSQLVPSNVSSLIIPTSASRSDTDSPVPLSDTNDNSPKFPKSKKKDFKHFMDKLVRTKLFSRQDSNSSQSALVDDETLASRSSCGSVSESMFSESSESICSTPDTAHSYLNEILEDPESNAFLTSAASESDLSKVPGHSIRQNSLRCFERNRRIYDRTKMAKRYKECIVSSECEKDHCEGVSCSNCVPPRENKVHLNTKQSQEFTNEGYQVDTDDCLQCENCLYERHKSDNNRIRISAVDGGELRIQKLPRDLTPCQYCDHVFHRSHPYRGSVKEHKDAQNLEIMMRKQNLYSSLPRNYKRTNMHARKTILDANELRKSAHLNKTNTNRFLIDVCEEV